MIKYKVNDQVWGVFNGVKYLCKILEIDKRKEPTIYRLEMYPGITRWCLIDDMREHALSHTA